jgi:hypothetical protein
MDNHLRRRPINVVKLGEKLKDAFFKVSFWR